MMHPANTMRLQIQLTGDQVNCLLEEEIAQLSDQEKWRIRGHGTRTREFVRSAAERKIAEAVSISERKI